MPNIVTVNVSQQVASAPSQLQKTGALISTGGTNLAANSSSFLTSAADLAALLAAPLALSSLSWAGGVVTATAAAALPYAVSDTVDLTIAGATPAGYNGEFTCTITGANTFTYPLASDPGMETVPGTWLPGSVSELQQMVNTFFAQASAAQGVYVLELGPTGPVEAITALAAYIATPPAGAVRFYSFLTPRSFDGQTSFVTLAGLHDSPTSELYFFVTTTLANLSTYANKKSVYAVLENPAVPETEFSAAAFLFVALNYAPSSANLVAPNEWSYLYGVTAYPLTNAQATTAKAAGGNWVGTGAEGGISNTLIVGGQTMDLHPFNYWYSVDWLQINAAQALAAAVINGSNTPTNPLYYNQAGINVLQKVTQTVVNNGISFGLILPPAPVTAVPFSTYIKQNPNDYAIGKYAGLACTFAPARGFDSIVLNLTATNIPV